MTNDRMCRPLLYCRETPLLTSGQMSTLPTSTFRHQLASTLGNRDIALGFLIGAGCAASVSNAGKPLIPPIAPLSEMVCEELRKRFPEPMKLLEKQFGSPPCAPNVEDLLSRVRALREVAGSDTVRGLSSADLEALDDAISEAILNRVSVDLPAGDTPYKLFAQWAAGFERRTPLEVFTTNYDILMEQAFESLHWPVFDGFVGSVEPFFDLTAIEIDQVPVRWIRLWKIHGSINWRLVDDRWVIRSQSGKKLLIYPSHLKYAESRRMPYLAIRDRLRAFFRANPCALITAGYSFADQHINEDLAFGLQSNRGSVCFALLYGALGAYENARRMASTHPNLTLLAADAVVSRSRENAWDDPDAFDLGDFAKFANFLISDVMGRTPVHAT